MIFGIGIDIVKISRFEKWVKNNSLLERFFNPNEISCAKSFSSLCQHYAVRFAAKEAFSKALGTGLEFNLRDVFITNDKNGKPILNITGTALELMKNKAAECKYHVSLTHEKEYGVAFVVLEV